MHVHLTHRVEMGFGSDLHIFYFLELLLPFPQENQIIALHQVVDSRLLGFDVIVGRPVRVESPLHALLNPRLRVDSILGELSTVVILYILEESHVIHL